MSIAAWLVAVTMVIGSAVLVGSIVWAVRKLED
jgi:hypothetical protein